MMQGFTHCFVVLSKTEIVLAERYDEDNGCHVVEAVYPLASLSTLPTNVVHSAMQMVTMRPLYSYLE